MHSRVVSSILVAATLTSATPHATWSESTASQTQATDGEMQVSQGWLGDLFAGRSRGSLNEGRVHPEPGEDAGQDLELRRPESGTLRALCVRLCDGFPFPISHATTRDRLSANARRCERSCPGRSRLFVVRASANTPDDAVDLQGQPYRKLASAFRYRTEYDSSCTCHGSPWEQEALARHRAYDEAERAGKAKLAGAAAKTPRSRETSRLYGRSAKATQTARRLRDDDD